MKFEKRFVGELVANYDSKRIPLSSRERQKRKGPYPYYGAAGILDYVDDYLFDGVYILLGEDGTVIKSNGTPILQLAKGKFWVNNHAHVLQNTELVDFDFLYYLLQNTNFSVAVTGAVQPKISQSNMNSIRVFIPQKIEYQKRIASVLKAIDDKIVLNSEINHNLQQQGMAIVEKYFSITQNQIALGDLMRFDNGFAFQSDTYLPKGMYRVITIKNVQDGYIDSSDTAYLEELPPQMKSCCRLQIGDVLLSLTGNVGRVGIVYEPNLLLNQRVAKIMPYNENLKAFLFFVFRHSSMKTTLEKISKGTAQQNLSPVETLKLTIPFNETTIENSIEPLNAIYHRLIGLFIENKQLATLRDTLLPKLMSGEIDVSGVEI